MHALAMQPAAQSRPWRHLSDGGPLDPGINSGVPRRRGLFMGSSEPALIVPA